MEIPSMDPVTGIVVAVIIATAAGFGAGVGVGGASAAKAGAKAIEAQTASIEALQDGQAVLLENATRPIVIDAELKSQLAEVPVQCRTDAGGDPTSVECQWATCLQFGQSSAQRPECSKVTELMIENLTPVGCPEPTSP